MVYGGRIVNLQLLAETTAHNTWVRLQGIYPGLVKPCPAITTNNRLKTTAGRAFYWLRKVDLSTELFAEYPDNFVQNTIPHEVCHQAAWDLWEHHGHGSPWKTAMLSIGINPQRLHHMQNTLWAAKKAGAL